MKTDEFAGRVESLLAMGRKVFVNLAVRDLDASIDFFSRLDFSFDSRLADDQTACLVLNENAYVLLLDRGCFRSLTNSTAQSGTLLAISVRNRDDVDALVNRALRAGARLSNEPYENGSIYGWGFRDLDGHRWEIVHVTSRALSSDGQ